MDEGKFAADFVSANLEKIYDFCSKVYGKADATIQISLRTAYINYINASRLKYSKSKSFFIRSQPVELYSYYVPTRIRCGNSLIDKPNFKKCLEFTSRVVIAGTGGSGKSVLIKHLFLDCIQEKTHVPILIELRDLNVLDMSLNEYINETLSNFGFNATREYLKKAKEAGHFCYFFDGMDEVTPKVRIKLIKEIRDLAKKYPKCPIFISSRPDEILDGLEDFSTFEMMPLGLNEALELVSKLPFDEIIKSKFCADMSSGLFEKHQSFLSNPLLLSIMLLTYGEYAEVPSKLSIFYNQAFDALFRRHDAYKGAYKRDRLTNLDIQDFSRVFALFSLQTYEKRIFKMPRLTCLEFIKNSTKILGIEVSPSDYLSDLLNAACLLIEDGLEITFSHRSFQEYFVALYISSASPEYQTKLIDRFWLNISSDNVIQLLREINPDLFERELLVPKLEIFFEELKIRKSVGISHLLNYLKLMYSTIDFDGHGDQGMRFTYHSDKSGLHIGQNMLLRLMVLEYSKFDFLSGDELDNYCEMMGLKYFSSDEEYKTESLNVKSSLSNDLNRNGSWHSTYYLAAAFAAFKTLKSKHANTSQAFDALLGLK